MRAIVQRVSSASVEVEGKVIGRCGAGFLLLVGVHKEDTEAKPALLADRVAGLRVFNDEAGKMNLAIGDLEPSGEPNILAISNFTVYGDAAKSRRPSFTQSAGYEVAQRLFNAFLGELEKKGLRVQTGEFGADMKVRLTNDGPVTLTLDV